MADDPRHPIGAMDFDTEDRLLPATHYRYGRNGRSGTSDKDSVGVVEGIRGNIKVADTVGISERIIGFAKDIKNNAIISFHYNPVQSLSFTSSSVLSTSPLIVRIISPNFAIPIGTVLFITESNFNVFSGRVTFIGGSDYTLTLLTGTPTILSVIDIGAANYHYIKRYFIDTSTTEFLTNPGLMGVVLGFNITDRIINARVINAGFTQFLAWTVYPNGTPCLMDIDKMKQT